MANVNHSTLTDPYLHEPKGVASANANEVYVANGSGSGSWEPQHHLIGAYLPFDATSPAYSHSATTSLSVINPTLTTSVTDGFTATNTPNARVIYSNGVDINSQIIITSILLLSSFFSIFLIYNLIFTKNHNLNFFNEDIHLLFYLLFLLIIFFVFLNFENNFSELFLSLTSSISNAGFSLNNSSNNLSFIFLILVIIGGSFFSTSSGIRFLKIYSLFKYSINEILSYSRPKNIYINKHLFSKDSFKLDEIYKYFLSVIVFIISLFVLTFLLTLNGIDFEGSFKLSILTIMNTVNSSMFGLSDFSFYDLHFMTKYYLIFFMIVGRLELLTLLIICKKFLFKS